MQRNKERAHQHPTTTASNRQLKNTVKRPPYCSSQNTLQLPQIEAIYKITAQEHLYDYIYMNK